MRLDVEIFGVGAQAGQVIGDLPDVFGDGHLVVVQNHDQIVQLADIVHALIDHTAGERAVAYNDDHLAALALDLFRLRHTDGSRKRRAAVPGNEAVTVAFLGVGEARDPVFSAQLRETGAASGQQLVGIALVTHVKQELILREFHNAVQRHGQFDHAQIGGQMPARGGDAADQKVADLLTQSRHILCRQIFYVTRCLDLVQKISLHTDRHLFFCICCLLRHRHGKADQNAQHSAGKHLNGGVTDHFLELFAVFQKGQRFAFLIHPFGKHTI